MKYHILAFGAGFLLDQLFGDPYFLPHPIRGIGWLIAKTEKTLRAGNPQGNPTEREGAERRQGKLLVVIVLLFTGMLSALILFGAYAMHPGLGVVIEAVMTYQILAARCLQVESSKVWKQLNAGSLEEARKAVSMIVGRDTEHLTEEGVAKKERASRLGVPSFVVRNIASCAKSYRISELRQAVTDFVDAEEAVKTGRLQDVLSVELLIVKYSSARR